MELLKDQLFNKETVSDLFNKVAQVTNFDVTKAVDRALFEFPDLELKQRITCLTTILHDMLDLSFEEAVKVFDVVITNTTDERFVYGAIQEYLETYGCNDANYMTALPRLGEYTSCFSAEFAIRAFINKYEKETLSYVNKWAESDNYHKRRLASEGTRPMLPWSKKIKMDYRLASEWLSKLFLDKERYVTRSVANHLNDISKKDPDFVLRLLRDWKSKRMDKEMHYIIHHSLRTLIKKGNIDALEFIGFKKHPNVTMSAINLDEKSVNVGDYLHFNTSITFKEDARVIIDYVVWYQSKSGRPSKKVYKLTKINGEKGHVYPVFGKVSFLERTTRKIYPGVHKLELQVNGDILRTVELEVK